MTTKIMTLYKIVFFALMLSFSTACKQQHHDTNTVVKATDFDISINAPDTIARDSSFFAEIHVDNKKYQLLFAHYACNMTDSTKTDTTYIGETKIKGCNNNLVIRNDSVTIYFEPGVSGKHTFEEVTLLCKGPDNRHYYQKCTFDYVVK